MKIIRLSFAAITMIAACLFTAFKPAYGDTYQIFDLGQGPARDLFVFPGYGGIDDSGTVVVQDVVHVMPFIIVFETWVNGVHVSDSSTLPNLNYDNGTSCIPTTSGEVTWSSSGQSSCNNGHEVYQGLYSQGPQSLRGIFTGPNLSDLLDTSNLSVTNNLNELALNASGDFAWVDWEANHVFEAIDLTTRASVPESGSMALLATGVLAMAGAIRRRKLSSR